MSSRAFAKPSIDVLELFHNYNYLDWASRTYCVELCEDFIPVHDLFEFIRIFAVFKITNREVCRQKTANYLIFEAVNTLARTG